MDGNLSVRRDGHIHGERSRSSQAADRRIERVDQPVSGDGSLLAPQEAPAVIAEVRTDRSRAVGDRDAQIVIAGEHVPVCRHREGDRRGVRRETRGDEWHPQDDPFVDVAGQIQPRTSQGLRAAGERCGRVAGQQQILAGVRHRTKGRSVTRIHVVNCDCVRAGCRLIGVAA